MYNNTSKPDVMKAFLPFSFFLFVVLNVNAQNVDFYGKEVANNICGQLGMKDDKEASDCMDKICDAAGIPNNFTLQPCPNIDNCYAISYNDISYIVYDITFFNKVKSYGFTEKKLPGKQIDWSALTILAHELGHHLCQHFTKNVREKFTPVQLELQADEYAGRIMYRLGATLEQAQQAMKSNEVSEEASLTHPARKDRLNAIAKGYEKEAKKYGGVNAQAPAVVNATTATQPTQVTGLEGLVLVQGGTFTMGGNSGEKTEKPPHTVTVSSFYISKYEVTMADFRKFIKATGYITTAEKEGKSWMFEHGKFKEIVGLNWLLNIPGNSKTAGQDDEPVTNVSWEDCTFYCQWLSRQTGKTYRLPTEAEWEFAAHGGNKSNGYTYSGGNNADDVGWYNNNSANQVHPVGQKQPNELGLYDMSGNISEFCSDWYWYYDGNTAQNPQGPATGNYRTIRGGSFAEDSQLGRVTSRRGAAPHSSAIGFRVAASF